MSYKIALPIWDEAIHSIQHKKGTSLDYFIYDYEPPEYSEREKFRDGLENALNDAIEEHDTFRLTTDAPEMTVGDSGSASLHSTNELYGDVKTRHMCKCEHCGKIVSVPCDLPRIVSPTKPE